MGPIAKCLVGDKLCAHPTNKQLLTHNPSLLVRHFAATFMSAGTPEAGKSRNVSIFAVADLPTWAQRVQLCYTQIKCSYCCYAPARQLASRPAVLIGIWPEYEGGIKNSAECCQHNRQGGISSIILNISIHTTVNE